MVQDLNRYMNQRKINQLYQDITDPNRAGGAFNGSQELTEENYPELASFTIPYTESTGINTNWQDQTYRMAYTNSFNVGYRGGNFKRNLAVSLGVLNQQGVIVNSNNKRITYNMNAKRKAFNNKIDVYSKTNISHKDRKCMPLLVMEKFLLKGVSSHKHSNFNLYFHY